ncbi:tail fiber protein [Paenibacillus tuaregi]|uniref:tail fiber protein n=1 Tax=Paenibacillus tuaregi TaxID=1816681 RepID=UPI0008388604|nr:tail fiber protein [Paenibacillus tuaregi]
MPSSTPNLGLHKKDPVTDGNETFNIKTMLNDNWDKIDAAVGGIKVDIPDASLTRKGKVQLSSSTNGSSESLAATEKAVKVAKEEAAVQSKAYTDQQINLVTETGIPKLVSYPLLVTATTDNQTSFEIPLDTFDSNTDTLLVSINRATLDATQYTVTNTVREGSGKVTQRAKLNLSEGISKTSEVAMVVLKNVPIGAEGAINGAVLAEGSVPINRVNGLSEHFSDYVRQPAFASTTGTSTAYVVSLTPAPASIPTGFGVTIVPHVDCGANPTLNINGLGAVALKDQKGVAYTAGKLKAGMPYTFRKVGTDFLADSAGGSGTAMAGDVRAGKTAAVDTGDITGALITQSATAQTITPGTTDIVKPAGIYDGTITVKGETNLTAGNIKNGVTMFGIAGTLKPSVYGTTQPTYRSTIRLPANQTSNQYSSDIVVFPAGISTISLSNNGSLNNNTTVSSGSDNTYSGLYLKWGGSYNQLIEVAGGYPVEIFSIQIDLPAKVANVIYRVGSNYGVRTVLISPSTGAISLVHGYKNLDTVYSFDVAIRFENSFIIYA